MPRKIRALDMLAEAQDLSPSYLINETITNHVEMHAYQDALVRRGLGEVRRGELISHEEVVRRMKKSGRTSE